ncbi:MAG: hypothetical protein HY698_14170 [Deltaproteobacteria bacterium]|nr:hypothetical protein [Deltaproteobacteria bacterium]
MSTDPPSASDPPAFLRVKLKYADIDTFVEKFAPNVNRGGFFLASRTPKPVGTTIRFELLAVDGKLKLLKGEGTVAWVREFDPKVPERAHGMGIKFSKLDADSRKVVDRILQVKREKGVKDESAVPAPMVMTESGPVAVLKDGLQTIPPAEHRASNARPNARSEEARGSLPDEGESTPSLRVERESSQRGAGTVTPPIESRAGDLSTGPERPPEPRKRTSTPVRGTILGPPPVALSSPPLATSPSVTPGLLSEPGPPASKAIVQSLGVPRSPSASDAGDLDALLAASPPDLDKVVARARALARGSLIPKGGQGSGASLEGDLEQLLVKAPIETVGLDEAVAGLAAMAGAGQATPRGEARETGKVQAIQENVERETAVPLSVTPEVTDPTPTFTPLDPPPRAPISPSAIVDMVIQGEDGASMALDGEPVVKAIPLVPVASEEVATALDDSLELKIDDEDDPCEPTSPGRGWDEPPSLGAAGEEEPALGPEDDGSHAEKKGFFKKLFRK